MTHIPFMFTEEQDAFRETVRRLSAREFAESYLKRAASPEFPKAALQTLARHGLLGLGIPAELGGQEADPISIGIAIEEVARADFNVCYMVFNATLLGGLIARYLDPRERDEWARAIIAGKRWPAFALTEPGSGSDSAALRLRATRVENGWTLSGEKTSVTCGPHADAVAAFATVDPGLGARGIACFLVDLDDPTISRRGFKDPGFRPMGRGSITFDGTFVPAHRLIGQVGKAFHLAMNAFELSRTLLGLMCIGVTARAIEMTIEYARQRQAFGRPISRYQGVSFVLAEHETYLEAARSLCYRALGMRQAGLSCNKEAAMVKWWAPQLAVRAINDCIVVHGHVGWSDEMPFQQMLRDVSGLQIGDGTPQIQKLIIARQMFGYEYV
jgi:cyclohexanecarboxyl-CoA dehydrogenase